MSDKVKILFLGANPIDVVARLRVEQEFREIKKKILEGPHSDQLEVVPELAVRVGDLQAALLRHEPDIVHFSGHCRPNSGIVLEDEQGLSTEVSRQALTELFRILKGNIRVVVLNACYAKEQAQALTAIIDCAIGMNDAIEDQAALRFAAQFYQLLAYGCSVQTAFQLACNQLELEGLKGAQIPELLVREGADASRICIVNPSAQSTAPESELAVSAESAEDKSEDWFAHPNIPDNPARDFAGQSVMRGHAGNAAPGKPRPVAFLTWLFASLTLLFTTDSLRRFVSDNSGWAERLAFILQIVFILFAGLALLLMVLARRRPTNPLTEKAAGSGLLPFPARAWKTSLITGMLLVITFGFWLALPLIARYYNESGIGFQYADPPDLWRARQAYQQAVRLQPSYAQAHYNLALVEEDVQPETAMEEYRLAIRYDNRIYPAYNNLARLYLRNKDYESALNLLHQGLDLSPPDENVQYSFYKNLGWANYALGHYALAEVDLRRAISLRPAQSAAAAHCLLAYVLKAQNKAEAADECFACVTLAPGETDVEARWLSDAQECLMKGDRK